jgi:hypothetical protein
MLVTVSVALVGVFAVSTVLAARRDLALISERPYENVHVGLPRSARTSTTIDL